MMRASWSPLFAIEVHHGYYAAGRPGPDVAVLPTPETARLVRERGLICRQQPGGVAIYAEVSTDGPQPTLVRSVGGGGLRFAFSVEPRSSRVGNITELPTMRPGRQVFCFDNLREDVVDGSPHLGDSIDDSRLGPPVRLETGSELRYELDPPVTATTVEAEDRFGATAMEVDVALDPPQPLAEALIEKEWDRLAPGRYRVFHGGDDSAAIAVYRGPGLARARALAVVEVFDRTDGLAADGVNRVPAPYRFLDGDQVTPVTYRLRLEARATTWKYIVVNKHRPDETDLATLTITGATTFTRLVQGDRAVFTSDAPRAVTEATEDFTLENGNGVTLDLPTPDASTPLEAGAGPDEFVSPIYVYV